MGVQMTPDRPCVACGADVPEGARFCPNCGTLHMVARPVEKPATYGTIGVGVLIGILGLLLIPATIAVWDSISSGPTTETAAVLGAIALTIATAGVLVANFAFIDHLQKRRAWNWAWGTQAFILWAWLFAAVAAIVAITEN